MMLNKTKVILIFSFFYTIFCFGQEPTISINSNTKKKNYSNNKVFTSEDIYINTVNQKLVYNKNLKDLILINHCNGTLECYDSNFKSKWLFKPSDSLNLYNGRNKFYYKDGVIHTGYYNGFIYALNAKNGEIFWEGKIGLDSRKTHFSSQTLKPFQNKLILSSRTNKNVYAIDMESGNLKWNYQLLSPNIVMPYSKFKEIVYINNDPVITSFEISTGKPIAQKNFNTNFGKTVSSKKFIITYLSRKDKIVALSPIYLEQIWEYKLDKNHNSIKRKILIHNDKVYFGAKSKNNISGLYCLDTRDGKLVWKKNIDGNIKKIQQIDNTVYGYTEKGKLFYVTKKGKIKTFQLKNTPISNFQKSDKSIYFNSINGLVKYNLKRNKEKIIINYTENNNRDNSQILLIK